MEPSYIITRHLKPFAQQVVKECYKQGESVSEALAMYMVRLIALDPSKQDVLRKDAPEALINDVKTICCNKLLAKYNPSIAAVKMQIYYDLNFRDREEFIRVHRQMQDTKLSPVMTAIMTKQCFTEEEMKDIYDKIILYLILKAGMGSPSDSVVHMETRNALLSFFSVSGMSQFSRKNRKEKKRFVDQLCPIITGLRLYSWHQRKGGCGINNVSDTLREATPRFSRRLDIELTLADTLIKKLQRMLQYHLIEKPKYQTNVNALDEGDHEAFSFWKSLLACFLQYHEYISIIKEESDALNIRVCDLECRFRMCIGQLNTTVKSSSTFPVNRTFPLYKYLSDVWKCMQEEALLLSSYSKIVQELRKFAEHAEILADEDEIDSLSGTVRKPSESEIDIPLKETWPQYESTPSEGSVIQTAAESETLQCISDMSSLESSIAPIKDVNKPLPSKRISTDLDRTNKLALMITGQELSLPDDGSMCVIFPDEVKNFEKVSLCYQGFCVWTLVTGKGILIPARRELGIVAYNNKYYGFCSREAVILFLQNPNLYLEEILQIARESPELVVLLQLLDDFDISLLRSGLEKPKVHPIYISDSGTQTVLHPIERLIDSNYRWNEWDLRKLALKYVDMLDKKTHSTQTDLSHFRRENFSQVWLPKDNWSQTKRDGSSTMPRSGIPELIRRVRKTVL